MNSNGTPRELSGDVYFGSQVWTVVLSADYGSIIERNGRKRGVANEDLRPVTADDEFRSAAYLGLPTVTDPASAEEEAYAENADRTLFARLEELARIKIESARARERAVTGDEMHDAQAAWTKARNEQRATFAAMDSATYSRWLAR